MTPIPANPSRAPTPRDPRRRALHDAAYSVAPTVLQPAWTRPARRTPSSTGSVSAQSLIPAAAVGRYAANPTAISRSLALPSPAGATTSSSDALVNDPITTSVSIG